MSSTNSNAFGNVCTHCTVAAIAALSIITAGVLVWTLFFI
jgi:hypothetical protein